MLSEIEIDSTLFSLYLMLELIIWMASVEIFYFILEMTLVKDQQSYLLIMI